MNFPLDASQYEIIRQIFSNKYCSTYIARCLINEKLVCLRKIDLEKNQDLLNIIGNETRNWSTISHPNMMTYYASFIDQNFLLIISEMVDQGSLLDILHFQYSDGIKDELLIASILQQILQFLKYYHQIHQVHRSLETNNIYVFQNGSIKVGGFWQARSFLQDGFLKNERASSIDSSCYTAPELIEKGKCYSQSVDIWSLGIIAYELAVGKTPYSDLEPLRQVKEILSGTSPSLPSKSCPNRRSSFDPSVSLNKENNFSPVFCDFVKQCLDKDPIKRPSAADLLKHKFVLLAKSKDYIYVNLMIHLPPLSQRIALHDQQNDDKNLYLKNSLSTQNPITSSERPQKKVVKKGRFTLIYPTKSTTSLL
ncbi:hypothetical protein M9Y10_009179 [Tritrichomonas musculus]|uniref:Protein kinase domain-containing protein n=1 Tax=Tritrichomonas musculus TaxID=1915356 RepID=A0ABR2INU1_9EUKA